MWRLEKKDSHDWVSAYRSIEVNEVKDRGMVRKTWDE